MGRWRRATGWVVVVTVALLIGWDLLVVATPESGDTISEVVRAWAHRYPALPFGLGFVCGHWFWGARGPA